MAALPLYRSTIPEYWALEEFSEIRHEYYDGNIVAMTGGTPNHATVILKIGASLHGQLRGKPCQAFVNDVRVSVPTMRVILTPMCS